MNQSKNKLCGITKVEVIDIEYTWKIYKFSSICKENGECITSTTFTHSKNSNVMWCLKLYPNGDCKDTKGYVSLFLYNVKGCDENNKFHVQMRFNIVNDDQEEKFGISTDYIFSKLTGYGYNRLIKKDYIQNKDNGILSNDTLIIVCKMAVSGGSQSLTCQNEKAEDFNCSVVHSCSQFSDNFALLLDDKELTDLTLIASDQEFQVHKAIIAAQSSVFMAMFKTDMKEKREKRVLVTDFNSNVISAMLHYMYTGIVKNVDDYSFDLLEIADKYAIDGLKSISENMLHKKLNINNAVETLLVADRCNCQLLKTMVIEFIIAHKNVIIKSKEFEAVKRRNPNLAIEVLCNIVTA